MASLLLTVLAASCRSPPCGRIQREPIPDPPAGMTADEPHHLTGEAAPGDPRGERRRDPTLSIDDPAPPIVISEWLGRRRVPTLPLAPPGLDGSQSQMVPLEQGVVTMIDFWASWCAPCLASMPHASQMQDRFGESLRIIAITALDGANTRTRAREALLSQPAMERLLVAIDAGTRTTEAYRSASGERRLPRAFVIDGAGRLAWIGHPLEAAPVIEAIIAGRWDSEAERARVSLLREARRRGHEALERLHRANAHEDLCLRIEALRTLAALPPEAQVLAPHFLARCELIRSLSESGAVEEAVGELERAVADAEMHNDAEALAALAHVALPLNAERAGRIAARADTAIARIVADWTATPPPDEWTSLLRRDRTAALAEAAATLAAVHRAERRLDHAIRLQSLAVSLAESIDDFRSGQLRSQLEADLESRPVREIAPP